MKYFKKPKQLFALLLLFVFFSSNISYAFAQERSPLILANNNQSTEETIDFSQTKELLNKKINTLSYFYETTNIQYALIYNGEIVISDSVGKYSITNNTPISKENMYCIASISKVFTATAVMKLVDEGKIDLDTPVVNYIPDFQMADERYVNITPRMLLNHSSGIMGSSFENTLLLGDNDTTYHDNFLKTLSTQRLKAAPGAFSVYCNDGFTLAEILVEKVSGLSFSSFISQKITNPLKLKHTKTPQDGFIKDLVVRSYMPLSKKELPIDTFNAIGAGGIYSNAEDLCNFAQTFMKDSNNILTYSSIKAMQNKEYLNGQWLEGINDDTIFSYGLGFDSVDAYPYNQYGIRALTKGGDSLMTHSSLTILPDQNMAFAILTTGSTSTSNQILASDILLTALKETGHINEILPEKTFTKPVQRALPSGLKKYEGVYASALALYKVTLDNNGTLNLYTSFEENAIPQKYLYTKNGKFLSTNGSSYIKFVQGSNGIDYLYVSEYITAPGLGQTILSCYAGQKLTPNKLSKNVSTIWEKRSEAIYFCISEKYSSQSYLSFPATKFSILEDISGYMGNAKIIDANTAQTLLEIPVMYGRDLSDYTFYKSNSIEYFKAGSHTYISEDGINFLSSKKTVTYTIPNDVKAKWYKIGKSLDQKSISINSPKNTTVVLYDKNGKCLYNAYLEGKKTIKLSGEGYIAFVGNSSDKFTVTFK